MINLINNLYFFLEFFIFISIIYQFNKYVYSIFIPIVILGLSIYIINIIQI